MGQRTFILLKKNYLNNNGEWASRISLIHHQWGIGRVMLGIFMQEALKTQFLLDRSLSYLSNCQLKGVEDDGFLAQPISRFYTFAPLNNFNCNYSFRNSDVEKLGLIPIKTNGTHRTFSYYEADNKTLKTTSECESNTLIDYPCKYDYNIFNIENIQAYAKLTDNNNGCMLVEVTQQHRNGEPESIVSESFKVKIGFCTGSEEEDYYNDYLNGAWEPNICINPSFSLLCSPEFYAIKTFGAKGVKQFVKAFRTICNQCNVEICYNKEDEKTLISKEKTLTKICEGLHEKGYTALSIREELAKIVTQKEFSFI